MASPPILDDPNQSARRVKTRIGVAAVLLTVAIGGLALLNQQKPKNQVEERPPQKQESISSEAPAAVPADSQISSAEQEPPIPAPVEDPPPPPSLGALPPVTSPAPSGAPDTKPSFTTVTQEPIAEKPLEKPVTPVTASKPPQSLPAPTTTTAKHEATPRSFDVQVGVFTDMENARQLQAKLAEHGIPSHTETRLQLGPFTTKAEADAAKEKLKAMGVGAVVVPGK